MLPAVKGVFTMRLNKAIINSSLVLLLALGLGGCATNNSASTHKTSHEPTSAKITKANNHKKAANDSTDQPSTKQESNQATANKAAIETPASYANVNQPASVVNPVLANSSTVISGNQAPVAGQTNANQSNQLVRPEQNTQQAVNNDDEQELPAPFYYYWVWNDEQGRTHNVDWDLSDAINQNGKLSYADYIYEQDPNAPVEFPRNAVQYDTREFNLHYDGTDQWILNFDNQINANPNHGVVNRMN